MTLTLRLKYNVACRDASSRQDICLKLHRDDVQSQFKIKKMVRIYAQA